MSEVNKTSLCQQNFPIAFTDEQMNMDVNEMNLKYQLLMIMLLLTKFVFHVDNHYAIFNEKHFKVIIL